MEINKLIQNISKTLGSDAETEGGVAWPLTIAGEIYDQGCPPGKHGELWREQTCIFLLRKETVGCTVYLRVCRLIGNYKLSECAEGANHCQVEPLRVAYTYPWAGFRADHCGGLCIFVVQYWIDTVK